MNSAAPCKEEMTLQDESFSHWFREPEDARDTRLGAEFRSA